MKKYLLIIGLCLLVGPMFSQIKRECEPANVFDPEIKPLFIDLVNHLVTVTNGGQNDITTNYNPTELQVLTPYLEQTPIGLNYIHNSNGNLSLLRVFFSGGIAPQEFLTPNLGQQVSDIYLNGDQIVFLLVNGQEFSYSFGRPSLIFCPCNSCYTFQPSPGDRYILSAWVKEEHELQVYEYTNTKLELRFTDANLNPLVTLDFRPSGNIIDGWQRIAAEFTIPDNAIYMTTHLINENQSAHSYFDDIRVHPFNGNMKSFVYDPETQRLVAELDENNYATMYEYDVEGGLVRVKKETEKGVFTIQETRSGNSKLNETSN